jgi:hypothetical protein
VSWPPPTPSEARYLACNSCGGPIREDLLFTSTYRTYYIHVGDRFRFWSRCPVEEGVTRPIDWDGSFVTPMGPNDTVLPPKFQM